MKIGCIILAGGKNTRMGEDKALLEYKGKHFIEQIAGELSHFEEKIIVRGSNTDLMEVIDAGWRVVPDIYPEHGPMGGMHAALKACNSDAMFAVSCDMPLITGKLAEKICNEIENYDAVIAVSDDGKYHPLCGVYKKNLYKMMEEHLKKDYNRMMEVFKKCNVKYLNLDAEESRQLMNVNTPEEYGKLSSHVGLPIG